MLAFALAAAMGITELSGTGAIDNLIVVQAAEAQETLVYTGNGTITEDLDCTGYTDDDCWDEGKKQMPVYETGISGITLAENAVLRGKVTIDQALYDSLSADKSYVKLQSAVKLGDKWDFNTAGSYPYLNQSAFQAAGDGTYTASFEDKFSDITGGDLHEVLFTIVGVTAKGQITISDVTINNIATEDVVLPEAGPTVMDNFDDAENGSNAGWQQESGWQYANTVVAAVEEKNGSRMLKVSLDYTGCEGYSWSEAKIRKTYDTGASIAAYNLYTFDMIYPEALDGKFKIKVFATDGAEESTTLIEKEGTADVTDLGDGYKKAAVTVKFSPAEQELKDVTIGIVGVNTDFVGDVYLDNLTVSQYNDAADYVDITSVASETGTQADISGMPSAVSLADTNASAKTRALYAYLKNLDAKDQVLFGHQNDTHKHAGGRDGVYSDTKDVTGSISGLVGIDSLALTGVELGMTDTDAAIAECVRIGKEAAAEGAILTLSTHMPNMSNAKITATGNPNRPYDFSSCDFSEAKDLSNNCAAQVLPGGAYNAQFRAYLDIIAEYANGLGDIPVLFRPFHENNGGWFWWGSATTDAETYKAMFRYMVDYLTGEKSVHNLLYVYSPNGPLTDGATYLERYPGDDYIDILAFDYYDDYNTYPAAYSAEFFDSLRKTCQTVKTLADERGKVAAIAETGVRVMKADGSDQEGILVKDNPIKGQNWYSQVNAVAKETGMPYFLLWANFSDTNFYVPYKYSDTKGQELINEFIDFYNEASSVFADGTNFYGAGKAEETAVANTNAGTVSGYFTNIYAKSVILKETTLKANVKNAKSVKFRLENGSVVKEIPAVKGSGSAYTGTITAAVLSALGKTDVGKIVLVADNKDLSTLSFISFGKEKDVLPENVIENFELYYGDNDYLSGIYSGNSAANCSSAFILDKDNKAGGTYGGAFTYHLKTNGSEVWTGQMKGLATNNYQAYNALTMWVKPDGKGQKLVIQLVSNGEDFEAYLTDFAATTTAKYVTIPFSRLKGKNGGTFDPSNITKFAVWCNSVGNTAADIESKIVFDDIRFVKADEASLALTGNGTYALTDSAILMKQAALQVTGVPKTPKYKSSFTLKTTGGSGNGAVTYAVTSGSKYAKIDAKTGKVTVTGVGKVTVKATKASDGSYDAQTQTISFTTKKADQKALKIKGAPKKLAAGKSATLSVTGGNGKGKVTYKVTGGSKYAKVSSKGKVTVTGIGKVTITVTKAAETNYNAKTAKVTIQTTLPAKNAKVTVGSLKYKVTKSDKKKGTVTCYAPASRNATSVKVPDTVKIGGVTFKVTAVEKNAFKNCKKLKTATIGKNVTSIGTNAFYGDKKLKTIKVTTKSLKKVGKNAFKNIDAKATIKVPASKLKAYKKLLKGKGQGRKVTIKK